MADAESIRRSLEDYGVYVEPRAAGPLPQMVGSLAGSMVGQLVANAARLGPIGTLVGVVGGAVAGHLAVTHKIRLGSPRHRDGPESPARYSDRR